MIQGHINDQVLAAVQRNVDHYTAFDVGEFLGADAAGNRRVIAILLVVVHEEVHVNRLIINRISLRPSHGNHHSQKQKKKANLEPLRP